MNFCKKHFLQLILLTLISLSVTTRASAHLGEHTIEMTSAGFKPSKITIEQGEVVVFKNVSEEPRWPASNIHPTHEIYPEFDPKKSVAPGESWSFAFEEPGVFRMHDHVHAGDVGTITVKADASVAGDLPKPTPKLVEPVFAQRSKPPSLFQRIIDWMKGVAASPKMSADTPQIFNDEKLLKQYIVDYGPAQTIQKLHQYSSQFGDCHQVAHNAGRISYEQFGAKAFQQCSAECHSGCYHGATEAYFKANGVDEIEKKLSIICNSELNSFFSHQCIHGIGHGLTAWTDYDIPEALKYCDSLKTYRDSCYTGVFMENIVGGLAKEASTEEKNSLDRHFTKYLSDDPEMPCTVVADKYKLSCYFYQTSRMVQLFSGDFSKVAAVCGQIEPQYRGNCFSSMGRDAGGYSVNKPEQAIRYCGYAPLGDYRNNCISGAVQNTLWDTTGQAEALTFCSKLTNKDELKTCYLTIIGRAGEVVNKTELPKFCEKIPKEYRLNCKS